jgi:hypothetical protein
MEKACANGLGSERTLLLTQVSHCGGSTIECVGYKEGIIPIDCEEVAAVLFGGVKTRAKKGEENKEKAGITKKRTVLGSCAGSCLYSAKKAITTKCCTTVRRGKIRVLRLAVVVLSLCEGLWGT